jgi:hypothetical protein
MNVEIIAELTMPEKYYLAKSRSGLKDHDVAREMGMSMTPVFNRINGILEFKDNELEDLSRILDFPFKDKMVIVEGKHIKE